MPLFRLRLISVLFLEPLSYPESVHEASPALDHALLTFAAGLFFSFLFSLPICLVILDISQAHQLYQSKGRGYLKENGLVLSSNNDTLDNWKRSPFS